ncbi:helix-turn-helix transcriptional regulator [Eubacterium sp. 1001713B170207_170306_E7]|uniref:helix-turn-helix domain-containing protein n=1 Tax=Eubacterium sp. 1001713B170207_170306_E7 TaxID=2787097 RepID=UPI0018979976|nr:helix-turn-helix transcriptional regulator [Eubacterium sp. 1001713B170207_170306_E7]
MSVFSERLKELIENNEESVYQLAKKAEVNRTVIHKVLSGERVPKKEFVDKITKAMSLTPFEKKEITELWLQTKLGDKIYYRRKKVKEVIESLSGNPLRNYAYQFEKQRFTKIEPSQQGWRMIQGKENVEKAVLAVLGDSFKHFEEPEISFYLPNGFPYFFELLYNFYIDCEKSVSIRHLVYIEKDSGNNEKACLNNLETLEPLLAFGLNSNKDYEPRYFCGEGDPRVWLELIPNNFIMTNRCVMCFERSLETVIYFDTMETLAHFKKLFNRAFENAPHLLERGKTIPEMYGWSAITEYEYIIEPTPCLAKYFSRDFLNAIIKQELPEREAILKMAADFYGDVNRRGKYPLSIFNITSLGEMLETGIVRSLPHYFVRPFTRNEICAVLEDIRQELLNHSQKYMAINSEAFHVPMDTEIIKTNESEIAIRSFNADGSELTTVFLRENSIVRAFSDFFDYLKTSRYVYSDEELAELIDKAIRRKN